MSNDGIKLTQEQLTEWRELCEWLELQKRKCSYSPIHNHLVQKKWRAFRQANRLVFYSTGWGWRVHIGWRDTIEKLSRGIA